MSSSVDLNQIICFNFYRGWREVSSIYKEILGGDISPQNVYILELCELENRITMNQLSIGMQLEKSAVSTLVARMEKKFLLKRTHGTEDRRTVFVKLTEAGSELREKIRSKSDVLVGSIGHGISAEDIQKLQEIVSKITKNRKAL
jgi:DNA-binding MarR family transcriptional regulator